MGHSQLSYFISSHSMRELQRPLHSTWKLRLSLCHVYLGVASLRFGAGQVTRPSHPRVQAMNCRKLNKQAKCPCPWHSSLQLPRLPLKWRWRAIYFTVYLTWLSPLPTLHSGDKGNFPFISPSWIPEVSSMSYPSPCQLQPQGWDLMADREHMRKTHLPIKELIQETFQKY